MVKKMRKRGKKREIERGGKACLFFLYLFTKIHYVSRSWNQLVRKKKEEKREEKRKKGKI